MHNTGVQGWIIGHAHNYIHCVMLLKVSSAALVDIASRSGFAVHFTCSIGARNASRGFSLVRAGPTIMAWLAAYAALANLFGNQLSLDCLTVLFHTLDGFLELLRILDRELISRLEILQAGKHVTPLQRDFAVGVWNVSR